LLESEKAFFKSEGLKLNRGGYFRDEKDANSGKGDERKD